MIFYTVNAGLYFYDGESGVLIDGLHEGAKVGFSDMPEILRGQMRRHAGYFEKDNLYLFTHEHPDHFSAERLEELLTADPAAPVWSPLRRINFRADGSFSFHAWHVDMLPAVHDGSAYADVPLYSCLLQGTQGAYLIVSDAILTRRLAELTLTRVRQPLDAAFVNFYQLFSQEGREALQLLRPKKICLYHLPFERDDRLRIWRLSRRAAEKFGGEMPVALLQPMTVL